MKNSKQDLHQATTNGSINNVIREQTGNTRIKNCNKMKVMSIMTL